MMSSAIYYKFKSKKESSKIVFDGSSITIKDLRNKIILHSGLKANDMILKIERTKDQTNESTEAEYKDEDVVKKFTTVIVSRMPCAKKDHVRSSKIRNPEMLQKKDPYKAMSKDRSQRFHEMSKAAKLYDLDVPEDEKINMMMKQSTDGYILDYHPRNPNIHSGPPPPSYVCFKCKHTGHYVQQCPGVKDKDGNPVDMKSMRRPTGIPQDFLVEVEKDTPGAYLTRDGRYMLPVKDRDAYARGKKEKKPFSEEENPVYVPVERKPVDEIVCPLCKQVMRNAVFISCCGNSYCQDCLTDYVFNTDVKGCGRCPNCNTEVVNADSFVPNPTLRDMIHKFNSGAVNLLTHTVQSSGNQNETETVVSTVADNVVSSTDHNQPPAPRAPSPVQEKSTIEKDKEKEREKEKEKDKEKEKEKEKEEEKDTGAIRGPFVDGRRVLKPKPPPEVVLVRRSETLKCEVDPPSKAVKVESQASPEADTKHSEVEIDLGVDEVTNTFFDEDIEVKETNSSEVKQEPASSDARPPSPALSKTESNAQSQNDDFEETIGSSITVRATDNSNVRMREWVETVQGKGQPRKHAGPPPPRTNAPRPKHTKVPAHRYPSMMPKMAAAEVPQHLSAAPAAINVPTTTFIPGPSTSVPTFQVAQNSTVPLPLNVQQLMQHQANPIIAYHNTTTINPLYPPQPVIVPEQSYLSEEQFNDLKQEFLLQEFKRACRRRRRRSSSGSRSRSRRHRSDSGSERRHRSHRQRRRSPESPSHSWRRRRDRDRSDSEELARSVSDRASARAKYGDAPAKDPRPRLTHEEDRRLENFRKSREMQKLMDDDRTLREYRGDSHQVVNRPGKEERRRRGDWSSDDDRPRAEGQARKAYREVLDDRMEEYSSDEQRRSRKDYKVKGKVERGRSPDYSSDDDRQARMQDERGRKESRRAARDRSLEDYRRVKEDRSSDGRKIKRRRSSESDTKSHHSRKTYESDHRKRSAEIRDYLKKSAEVSRRDYEGASEDEERSADSWRSENVPARELSSDVMEWRSQDDNESVKDKKKSVSDQRSIDSKSKRDKSRSHKGDPNLVSVEERAKNKKDTLKSDDQNIEERRKNSRLTDDRRKEAKKTEVSREVDERSSLERGVVGKESRQTKKGTQKGGDDKAKKSIEDFVEEMKEKKKRKDARKSKEEETEEYVEAREKRKDPRRWETDEAEDYVEKPREKRNDHRRLEDDESDNYVEEARGKKRKGARKLSEDDTEDYVEKAEEQRKDARYRVDEKEKIYATEGKERKSKKNVVKREINIVPADDYDEKSKEKGRRKGDRKQDDADVEKGREIKDGRKLIYQKFKSEDEARERQRLKSPEVIKEYSKKQKIADILRMRARTDLEEEEPSVSKRGRRQDRSRDRSEERYSDVKYNEMESEKIRARKVDVIEDSKLKKSRYATRMDETSSPTEDEVMPRKRSPSPLETDGRESSKKSKKEKKKKEKKHKKEKKKKEKKKKRKRQEREKRSRSSSAPPSTKKSRIPAPVTESEDVTSDMGSSQLLPSPSKWELELDDDMDDFEEELRQENLKRRKLVSLVSTVSSVQKNAQRK